MCFKLKQKKAKKKQSNSRSKWRNEQFKYLIRVTYKEPQCNHER